MVVERHIACDHTIVIYRIVLWRDSRPKDDGIRIGIARCHAMGEVKFRGEEAFPGCVSLVDFVQRNAQTWMVLRGRAIVDVLVRVSRYVHRVKVRAGAMVGSYLGPARRRQRRTGKHSKKLALHVKYTYRDSVVNLKLRNPLYALELSYLY
jgi:hypothetical protein